MNRANRHRTSSGRGTFASAAVRRFVRVLGACLAVMIVALSVMAQDTTAPADAAPRVLRFEADGRVRLEAHDPNGRRIGRDVNEIEGATFEEVDNGMVLEIPDPVLGDYELLVDADGSANRIHLFDVWGTDGVTTVSLAERELIMNVPSEPYVIRVTADGLSDVTGTEPGNDDGGTSLVTWIVVIVAVVAVGGLATFLFLRARKRKLQ